METTYTVRGHWPFPVDMLRHDDATPLSDTDQQLIDLLSQEHAPDRSVFKDVDIHLVTPHKPNTARWESFGWRVPTDEMHEWLKAAAERDRESRRLYEAVMEKLTDAERAAISYHYGSLA